MPFPIAFLTAALPSIVELIPKLGAMFGSGSKVSDRNIALAETVATIVQNATGAKNIQEAVETMRGDPGALEAARKAVEDKWFTLTEAGGGGIAGAREFLKEQSDGPHGDKVWQIMGTVTYAALAFLVLANLMASAAWVIAVFRNAQIESATQLLTQVITADIGAALTAFGFWLGSSWGSRKKDETAA